MRLSKNTRSEAAMNEWRLTDVPPKLPAPTTCEACGNNRVLKTVVLHNEVTDATFIIGHDCYEHLAALVGGRWPHLRPLQQQVQDGERAFTRQVERRAALPHARLDAGSWTEWLIRRATASDLPSLVGQGIASLREQGFIYSMKILDACIRYHDSRRLFPAAVLYGKEWSLYAASSMSQVTIEEAMTRVEARAAETRQEAELKIQRARSLKSAQQTRRPSPAVQPSALATRLRRSELLVAQQLESLQEAISRAKKPPGAAPPVRDFRDGAPPPQRVEYDSGLRNHEALVNEAREVIANPPGELSALQDLRKRFMSQISRVEAANQRGEYGESTRPLAEIRTALQLIERKLGLRPGG